ncbi:Protein lplB [Listeria monocytogenes N53-1]|nr:Protein lplB [Listeria monocytogenes N53-1]
MIAWKMSGYYALILISGLASINHEIYEAAAMDGSGFGIFTEVYQLTGANGDFQPSIC